VSECTSCFSLYQRFIVLVGRFGEELFHIEQEKKALAKLLCCANFFKNFPKIKRM